MQNKTCLNHTNVIHTMHMNTSDLYLFILVPLCIHMLDHAEPEPEELATAEETNPELAEGKPQCIPPIFLGFSFNH
jgi:hypothetical protein